MPEIDWHAHYRCAYCHGLKAKGDIIHVDDKTICRHGNCKELHEVATRPRPVLKSLATWERG